MDRGQCFQRKAEGLNGFDTFSRTFPLRFLFLPVFVVVSILIRIIVKSYRIPLHENYSCCPNEGQLSLFIGFR